MNRDQGPAYNLGFGVNSRALGPDQNAQPGPNPNSGGISKALHDHPVMRFFAATAATMVATAVASQTVRKGGVKLFAKMQESELPYFTRKVKDLRAMRDIMDDWQGAVRTAEAYSPENADKLFWADPQGNIRVGEKLMSDGTLPNGELNTLRGWHQTYEEQQEARAYGRIGAETPSDWTIKNELTQRMVVQARRLPYELPAAYVAQRAVTDRLFGTQEKDSVNWANPADVISDFVTQSVKNTAFMFSPFEAGQGAATQGWRKLMTYGEHGATETMAKRNLGRQAVGLRDLLAEVGHDAGRIVNSTVDYTSQATGAFATSIKVANESQMNIVDFLHWYRHGTAQAIKNMNTAGMTRAQRWSEKATVYLNLQNSLDKLPGSPFDALPPFKGMASGLSAARREWTNIGEQRKAVNAMLSKGHNAFMRDATAGEKRALNEAMQVGASPVEELIGALNRLSGGAPVTKHGRVNPDWKAGEFYQSRVNDAFNTRLRRELAREGVSPESIAQFQKVVGVQAPLRTLKDPSRRFLLNGKELQAASRDDLWNQMAAKMNLHDPGEFIAGIPKALERADNLFSSRKYMSSFDKQVVSEWNVFRNEVFPRLGESVLGKNNLPYQTFRGNITRQKQDFLTRKVAEVSGLRMRDDVGDLVSDAMVENHLSRAGFDPTNFGQMRAYLAKHKAITQPWNKHGRNILGFKAVSVEDALDRGYFAASSVTRGGTETEIRGLLKSMSTRDPVSSLGSYKVGGLWESSHGDILDFNVIRRGIRRFTDKVADDFQIPLIHLSPLKTLGYSGFRNMREQSMIQYISGSSFQPFLGKREAADFYMWTRASARGSKGVVSAFNWDTEKGVLNQSLLPGKFRSMPTIGNTIEAHQVKIAAGDLGRIAPPRVDSEGRSRPPSRFEQFKSMMNISDHQPDSIFGWAKRFRGRKTDIHNPLIFSKLLAGEAVEHGEARLKLSGGEVIDEITGKTKFGRRQVAEAFDAFPDQFRLRAMPTRLEGLEGFEDVFAADLRVGGKVVRSGRVSLSEVKSQAQLIEFSKLMAAQDAADVGAMPANIQTSMRRAQRLLVYRHIRNEPSASYWDSAAPGVSGTISTRLDQFRSDIQEYMVVRKGLMGKSGGFDQTVAEMTENLSKLKASGQISQAQYIEARSALLGTQLDFTNLQYFRPNMSSQANTHAALGAFMSGARGAISRDLLNDVSSGKMVTQAGGGWAGRFARIEPFLKRQFGTAPYRYDGQEYNPFGRGGTALVPTFGTAYARNPRKAISNVLGVTRDTEGFSGSAIGAGHLVERLNKSFGLAGLQLDPTKYKSPIDMYARGLVGQRILPIVATGTAAVALDRTAGGLVNDRDANGDRVYSPLLLGEAAKGIAYAQAGLAGLVPGGMDYEQKYHEIFEGEVAVRSGRWWPLGNTPWKGGRVQYFRPSWYRRLKSGYSYTSDTYGTPLQRLLYGYDFSPLRPLDPYRFERQHYSDRPYPTTGEYFSGPWGPVTSVLNATVGRILKPQLKMHEDELTQGLSQYLPAGQQGAYFAPPGSAAAMSFGVASRKPTPGIAIGSGTSSGVYGGGGAISASNRAYAAAGQVSLATGRNAAFGAISAVNQGYSAAAYGAVGTPGAMPPKITGAAPPVSTRSLGYQGRQLGYELQEMAGIYGFAFGATRSALGFGNQDLTTPRPVLESASRAYGSTRGFWSLGLGGLGDVPTPLEGNLANLEISEIIRRFVPRERTATQFINPIANQMGKNHPWLPDSTSGYYIDFSKGDPYTKVPEGELRLPGKGYERVNQLHPDKYGKYGALDQFKILADVAPWSPQYRNMDKMIDSLTYGRGEREMVQEIRDQVGEKAREHTFSPYEHKYSLPGASSVLERGWETIKHFDTPFNTKFLPYATATEDWERNNVYGSTFPQWQHPIKDFLEPMLYKSTQRDPIHAALVLGGTGTLFGKSAQGKVIGGVLGSALGFAASSIGHIGQAISGRRYMPEDRRKEVALEEYADILNYVKNQKLANMASAVGDVRAASEFKRQAAGTLYGVDVYNAPLQQITQAIPKRKREHFQAMMGAPEQERDQILSTAGILERRALQAVWGRPVESRPDLDEYFQTHELPPDDSSVWNPNTNMDQVKIKVGQSMGLDLSQMGYYPQQIQEANLVNPAYPSFNAQMGSRDVRAALDRLMHSSGIKGDVSVIRTPYPGSRLEINAGIH